VTLGKANKYPVLDKVLGGHVRTLELKNVLPWNMSFVVCFDAYNTILKFSRNMVVQAMQLL